MSARAPEQPIWTLMLTDAGKIAAVHQEDAHLKLDCGWLVLWREADLLPFEIPELINDPWPPHKGLK